MENLWRQICGKKKWFEASALPCTIVPNRWVSDNSSSGWDSLSHALFLLRKGKAWRKHIGVLGFLVLGLGWERAKTRVSFLGPEECRGRQRDWVLHKGQTSVFLGSRFPPTSSLPASQAWFSGNNLRSQKRGEGFIFSEWYLGFYNILSQTRPSTSLPYCVSGSHFPGSFSASLWIYRSYVTSLHISFPILKRKSKPPFTGQVQKLHFRFRSEPLASPVLMSPSESVSRSLCFPPLFESGAL